MYSKEQLGRIVIIAVVAFSLFGIDVNAEQIEATLFVGSQLVVVVLTIWGYIRRYKKGDVTLLGRKV